MVAKEKITAKNTGKVHGSGRVSDSMESLTAHKSWINSNLATSENLE